MARKYVPLMLSFLVWAPLGCGGLSQDDLRQRTYARSKDTDEEKPTAPAAEVNATSAKATPVVPNSPAAQPQPQTEVATSAPKTISPITAGPSEPATSSGNPATVASVGGAELAASNPLDLPPSATTGSNTSAVAVSSSEVEEDEQPPVLDEDSSQAEIEAARAWHFKRKLKEQAKLEAAERQAEEEARKRLAGKRVTTDDDSSFVSTGNYRDESKSLQALLDRLTNPENLSPEELARVAQQLALDDATKESLTYYYAWLLTTGDTAEVKSHLSWSPALQRPVAAIHWGLGLEYTGDPKLISKADPIGSDSRVFDKLRRRHSAGKLKQYVGELGDRLLFGLDDRFESGALGDLLKPPPVHDKRQRSMDIQWEAKPTGFTPETLGRGITLLKGGTHKELLYIARHEGIDVLVIYDMNVKQPRNGPILNITELKLIDVARGKELYATPQLNNVKTKWARQNRTEKDPIEKEFDDLFAFVDEQLKLGPLPSGLNEENAKARIEALAASEPTNPLAAMAEMRLYQASGLVGDATLYAGYKVLIGDGPAKKLIIGKADQRVGAISKYLPQVEAKR